jgi:hypothetical protein
MPFVVRDDNEAANPDVKPLTHVNTFLYIR